MTGQLITSDGIYIVGKMLLAVIKSSKQDSNAQPFIYVNNRYIYNRGEWDTRRYHMEILILVLAMVVVGLIVGFVAGLIWKDDRPIGVKGDYLAAVITAVITGLIDWFVIPAMGFSDTLKYLGLVFEPAIMALLVLWVIRLAKK